MNSKIISFLACILFALSHNACAAIRTLLLKEVPNVVTYSHVSLGRGKDFFAMSEAINGKAVSRMLPITNPADKAWDLEMPFVAMFMATSQQADLLIGANATGEWIASRIGANRKITRQSKLTDFSFVTSATATNSGYIVSGRDSNGNPKVISLDRNLSTTRSFSPEGSVAGEANVVAYEKDTATIVINHENGKSSITWLSNTLSPIREVALSGGAASAIVFEDGMAVTYSSAKEVFVEALDKIGRSKWKRLVHKRNGASSLKFDLCSTTDGLGIIGANNAALIVTRLKRDGTISQTSSDKSGLLPPTDSRYVVSADGNEIHILGIANKSGADAHTPPFLFHFVDTPNDRSISAHASDPNRITGF